MIISRRFLPSLFTILNAFCGLMSIINTSNNQYEQACYFIIYASLFDLVDGFTARLLNSSSQFGVELDSLSDIVSFGVAPSFLLYDIHFKNYDGIGIFVSSLIMAFSALRLARFNISLIGFDKHSFKGVPTPMSALTIIAYILFYHNKLFTPEISNVVIFVLTISLSILMISRVDYPAIPKLTLNSIRKNPFIAILLLLSIVFVIISKGYGFFILCVIYVLFGLFESLFGFILGKKKQQLRKRHKPSRRK